MSSTLRASEEADVERIAMGIRERERAVVFAQVREGTLRPFEAAARLGLRTRQARRLFRRFVVEGAAGLVHRSVGRPSNRRWAPAAQEAALAFVAQELGGAATRGPGQRFGPTLAAEQVAAECGLPIPPSTLRRWMRAAGLWTRVRRHAPHRSRRPRAMHFGELVQLDGSPHDWFEGRGAPCCLLELVDDATGITLQQFAPRETTWSALDLLGAWIATYGVPRALYCDWHAAYLSTANRADSTAGPAAHGTQFGRICAALRIQLIGASSPQAKGRVERAHGTHQDRLVKLMRRAQIASIEAANAFLAPYTPAHNARFARVAAAPLDLHRPAPTPSAWAALCWLEYRRKVGRDGVIRYQGRELQLERSGRHHRVPDGTRVLVREARDGTIEIVHVTSHGIRRCTWHEAPPRAARVPRISADVPPVTPVPREPWRPPRNHPWRRQNNAMVADALAKQKHSPGGHF